MNKLASTLMISAGAIAGIFSMTSSATTIDSVAQTCEPRLISAPTAFPTDSMGVRTNGTVLLEVLVGSDGDVITARVHQPSRSRRLDRAAVRSALSQWKFERFNCDKATLPLKSTIAVTYQAENAHTFTATRVPGVGKQLLLAAELGCAISSAAKGDFVRSCIVDSNVTAPRIAAR
jgi:TonB family protein